MERCRHAPAEREPCSTDPVAFERFYVPIRERHLQYCYLVTGDRKMVEELAQEAAIKAFRKFRTLNDPSRAWAWLKEITRKTYINMLVREQRRGLRQAGEQPDADQAPRQRDLWGNDAIPERLDMEARIARLPDDLGEVVRRTYFEDQTFAEQSRLLDVAPSTIARRLDKALMLLHEMMLQEGGR